MMALHGSHTSSTLTRFSKTHKRRPTSVAGDLLNSTNMYITSDGTVLQSSLVKEGSPSKRKLTGSTSQVRFDLPDSEEETEEEQQEDNDHDSFLSEEEWEDLEDVPVRKDSYDDKLIFDAESKQVISSSQSKSIVDFNDPYEVSQSMRSLLLSSEQRSKLFIRPFSELNKGPIAIPVEARLPPPLCAKNIISKARPETLVYNGIDYEPFDLKLVTAKYLAMKEQRRIHSASSTPTVENDKFQGVVIPDDLSKPLTTKERPKSMTLDNEREIANPSQAAMRQNNELNRRFSFPPRVNHAIPPPLPEKNATTKEKPKGLQIFSPDGPFVPPSASTHRRSTTIDSMVNSSPEQEKLTVEHEANCRTIHQPSPQAPVSFTHWSPQESVKPLENQALNTEIHTLHIHDDIHMSGLSEPALVPRDDSSVYSEESIQDSIQDSIEDSIQDSVMESVQSTERDLLEDEEDASSLESNDSAQLQALGNLIISSGGDLSLTEEQIEKMDQITASQSHIYDNPLPVDVSLNTKPTNTCEHVVKKTPTEQVSVKSKPIEAIETIELTDTEDESDEVHEPSEEMSSQPLGTHWKPQRVSSRDTKEADRIRAVSQNMMKKANNSPMLSQSSYQSEATGLFSQPSSTLTDDTEVSQRNSISSNLVMAKRQQSFRSFIQEMDNGEFRETIEIDDEYDDYGRKASSGSLFSFETVASEVQMGIHSPLNSNIRRYTSQLKSVLELCDESMSDSRSVLESLKRQKTILIQRRNELMKSQKKDLEKLMKIQELQDKVKQVHQRQASVRRDMGTKRNMDLYFDYANSESYDFQSYMRNQSSSSISMAV